MTIELNALCKDIEIKFEKLGKDVPPGLFNGLLGQVVYNFSRYEKTKNISYYNKGLLLIEDCTELINQGNFKDFSFASGLAGFGRVIQFYRSSKVLRKNEGEGLLKVFDNYLSLSLNFCISNHNFDYLYGAIGIGFYFIERYPHSNEVKVEIFKLVEALSDSAIEVSPDKIKWESKIKDTFKGCNISTSHGMAGVLNFLCASYIVIPDFSLSLSLIKKCVCFLLSQRIDKQNSISYFPTYSLEIEKNPVPSRLSWCYGDLGICFSLLKASHILKDRSLSDLSYNILRKASMRRIKKETNVDDYSFCHGSSGNWYMFKKVYLLSGEKIFHDAADFWERETEIYLEVDKDKAHSLIDPGLLEGLCGVGLVSLLEGGKSENILDILFLLK